MHYLHSCHRPLRRYPLPSVQSAVSKPTRHVAHAPKVWTSMAISHRPSIAETIVYMSTYKHTTVKLPTTASTSTGWERSLRRCSTRFEHTAFGSTRSDMWAEMTIMKRESRSYRSISQRRHWRHGRFSLASSSGPSLNDTPCL